MVGYILRRCAYVIPTLLLVSILVFSIMRVLPGDPAALMLGGEAVASPQVIAQLRQQLGLNDPVYVQYGHFIWDALHGNLGNSTRLKGKVTSVIFRQFPFTAELSGGALAVSLLLGIPLGIIAALRKGTWVDSLAMGISVVGVSMPVFWLGLLLILFFAFSLGWFAPISNSMQFKALVLPAFSLGFINAGLVGRLVRSNMLEVLTKDYITTARAKGISEWAVTTYHALRNALIPAVTILGLQFGTMLTGAAVTETVFSRPGIGRLVVNAILWKDYPLVQGVVLFDAVLFLGVNLFIDLVYVFLDPRIAYD